MSVFTHQEVVLRVKGNTENRRLVAPESFLPAAVRHLHHLHQEVTEQSSGREKENSLKSSTRAKIIKSMATTVPISSIKHRRVPSQQPQVSFYSPGRYLQTITRARTAAEMSRHVPAALLSVALGLFGMDRLRWPAGQSGPIHKDNKDCCSLSEDAATSGTTMATTMTSLRLMEMIAEVISIIWKRWWLCSCKPSLAKEGTAAGMIGTVPPLWKSTSTLGYQVLIATRNNRLPYSVKF